MNFIERISGLRLALPPLHRRFSLHVPPQDPSEEADPAGPSAGDGGEPIAGFTCIIAYTDSAGEESERLITCKTLDRKRGRLSIGAICHARRAYRRFLVEQILTVSDAETGEVIGDGAHLARFALDSVEDGPPMWGLTRSRKATLLAGLNVLAFMARCDGAWHDFELEPIERYIVRMWIQKEWPGDPPMTDILAHTRRLIPDGDDFFKGLTALSRSSNSRRILMAAVRELIEADGVVCRDEINWSLEMEEYLAVEAERYSILVDTTQPLNR